MLIDESLPKQAQLTLIIPAYNEENRIFPTLRAIVDNIDDLKEIIVVADGNDKTANIARKFGEKVKVLEFQRRLGKGGAIIEGLKHADSEVIGFADADGSSPWREIQRLSRLISQDCQCVIGSRWVKDSNVLKKQSILRIILSRVYRYIAFAFLRINIKDLQCGLKMFNRDLIKEMIPKIRVKDWAFDTSLLYNITLTGKEIKEVGITWYNDEKTKVKVLKVAPLMFAYIIGLRIAHSKYSNKLTPAFEKFNKVLESGLAIE